MNVIESTSPADTLPCLTANVPAMPGAIKRRYEDFLVEEIPAYQPCGSGDHIYFTIEKRGLATMRALHDIGRALGVQSRDIGMAGLKDARAVTIQTLSIEHIDPKKSRGPRPSPHSRSLGQSPWQQAPYRASARQSLSHQDARLRPREI